MHCALCCEEADLRASHIIPEFMFKPLYGEDYHRFHVLSAQARNRYEQKGIREKLLCEACEQRFSVNERYVSQLMFGDLAPKPQPEGSTVVFYGVNYRALRLFSVICPLAGRRIESGLLQSCVARQGARGTAARLASSG
jgi:hypothetical protein